MARILNQASFLGEERAAGPLAKTDNLTIGSVNAS